MSKNWWFLEDIDKKRIVFYYSQNLDSYKILHNGGQGAVFLYKMKAQSSYRKAC